LILVVQTTRLIVVSCVSGQDREVVFIRKGVVGFRKKSGKLLYSLEQLLSSMEPNGGMFRRREGKMFIERGEKKIAEVHIVLFTAALEIANKLGKRRKKKYEKGRNITRREHGRRGRGGKRIVRPPRG